MLNVTFYGAFVDKNLWLGFAVCDSRPANWVPAKLIYATINGFTVQLLHNWKMQ